MGMMVGFGGVLTDAIAGKPGSHRDVRRTQLLRPPPIPVGASLLAMAVLKVKTI
ncbi:hypothetical protein [Pseudomonas sp. ES3-33]|jgi:hypothetical protein|uniref:hypothetical protein n=1 Tax=unclassified Pseudomonas TaxID=196821 RepID=UPI000A3E74D5|nr:hypothetical protein [Pseudomonas sp. ES3-33]